jgi:hypothetical protein
MKDTVMFRLTKARPLKDFLPGNFAPPKFFEEAGIIPDIRPLIQPKKKQKMP